VSSLEEAERSADAAAQAMVAFDVEAAVAHLSAAIRGFTAEGESKRAAMACLRLGEVMVNGLGNPVAGQVWFTRARRLLADLPACVEQGWAAVAPLGCDAGDPGELLERADLALDRARRFGDVNLESKALADAGLAHVQAGRIAMGMSLLDEAMALVCGPADDIETAGRSVCSFFTACYYTGEFERAASWAEPLRRRGLIGPLPMSPMFLSNHCDSVQARLLIELGRWSDAEALLTRAMAEFEDTMGQPSWHPAIFLADLRVLQGRHTDAEALLLGKDQAFEALLPAARLHLSRGDHDLAVATARRGLRGLGSDHLRARELLAVVVDAELARGDVDAACRACDDLAVRTGGVDPPVLRARAALPRARALAARGELEDAVSVLEEVADLLDPQRTPWQLVRVLIELARVREALGDRSAATIDAKAAIAALAGLDVVVRPEDRALLERLATDRPAPPVSSGTTILTRDGKWWSLTAGGAQVRLPDTKGLRYLAELVATPGVERHVLDLVDRIEGVSEQAGLDRRQLGDAGDLLDGRARDNYRRRVEVLRSEIDDALAIDAFDRAETLQAELEALVAELARAFGVGGRSRQASSAAERARLNVTRALRSATAKLCAALPGAGDVLDRRVRTGMYCIYEPVAGEVRWIVQS